MKVLGLNEHEHIDFDLDDNGVSFGQAGVFYEEDGIYLANFEVYAQFRGQGHSKVMLDYLISNYGVDTLIVECDNYLALSLYRKFGFEIQDKYYSEDIESSVYYMKRGITDV